MWGYGYNPFWITQCPARSVGLKHHHDPNCTDGHVSGQCCECGQKQGDVAVVKPAAGSPVDPRPVDVEARFRALGLSNDDRPIETVRDHETGARATAFVAQLPRKQRNALLFLKHRAEKEDLR